MAMSRSYRETTMSAHALESFFNPRGVAVFGASERPGALGTTVLANLIEAGFEGAIIPVNPRHNSVQGLPCRADLSGLDQPVDLAVIATPAATVPGILRQCGEAGVRGAVISRPASARKTRMVPNCGGILSRSPLMSAYG